MNDENVQNNYNDAAVTEQTFSVSQTISADSVTVHILYMMFFGCATPAKPELLVSAIESADLASFLAELISDDNFKRLVNAKLNEEGGAFRSGDLLPIIGEMIVQYGGLYGLMNSLKKAEVKYKENIIRRFTGAEKGDLSELLDLIRNLNEIQPTEESASKPN